MKNSFRETPQNLRIFTRIDVSLKISDENSDQNAAKMMTTKFASRENENETKNALMFVNLKPIIHAIQSRLQGLFLQRFMTCQSLVRFVISFIKLSSQIKFEPVVPSFWVVILPTRNRAMRKALKNSRRVVKAQILVSVKRVKCVNCPPLWRLCCHRV